MDEIGAQAAEHGGNSEQVVFLAPELLQRAQQRQERPGALREAAESGDEAALLELGAWSLGELGGTPRDADEAFACLSRLPADNAEGRYLLSYCYDRGIGTEQDTVLAQFLEESVGEGPDAEVGQVQQQIPLLGERAHRVSAMRAATASSPTRKKPPRSTAPRPSGALRWACVISACSR